MDLSQGPSIPNPVDNLELGQLLGQVINFLLVWGGAVAILFVIIGGFRYIVSMGNQEGVEKARQTVLYAILGLIIIFLSYLAIAYLMGDILSVKPAYRLD